MMYWFMLVCLPGYTYVCLGIWVMVIHPMMGILIRDIEIPRNGLISIPQCGVLTVARGCMCVSCLIVSVYTCISIHTCLYDIIL